MYLNIKNHIATWLAIILILLYPTHAMQKCFRQEFIDITLNPTQLPRSEIEKDFHNNFSYRWKVRAFYPRVSRGSVRAYVEEVPYIELTHLLRSSSNIPETQQYSVRFTKSDIENILILYVQGKLQLQWAQGGLTLNQYCVHNDDFLHTLAVTHQQKGRAYYKQQRYIGEPGASPVDSVFCDQKYQIEYWYDNEHSSWVVDSRQGELYFSAYETALGALKKLALQYHQEDEEDGVVCEKLSRNLT